MDGILGILENEDARRILLATYVVPKPAIELSFKLGISISKCYEILKKLEFYGLIVGRQSGVGKGRKRKVYQARLKNARLVMENDRMMIQFELPQEILKHAPVLEVLT
jgi:predicted transcriptional regulator